MKLKNLLLITILIFGSLGTAAAQNLGQIQRGQRGYVPPPLPRDQGAIAIENTLEDIDEKMDLYATEFELDAFEKAVVKNFIVEYEKEKMGIMADESIAYDVKQQSYKKLNEKLSGNLVTVLTEEQVARFGELHFSEKKKKKKKRRNRNN
ncbi:hypothetical protein [Gilvibacter sediminis]|uniref:hypothetical protein n=1 Tax=Gilvibacter sediminis TaxID=379071 RepID=UPI002350BF44|nr:hypothetical protein [Gilvibacter sediminis]MDC7997950.1 hypothetical protein [Gilvibacter sediminis]